MDTSSLTGALPWKKFILPDLIGAALIVPRKTGINYTNQVNGTLCGQLECEGVLIPINEERTVAGSPSILEIELCSLFDGAWDLLNESKADEIDLVLKRFDATKGISVNREKIHASEESWLHVIVVEHRNSCYSGFGKIEGILTWMNSD